MALRSFLAERPCVSIYFTKVTRSSFLGDLYTVFRWRLSKRTKTTASFSSTPYTASPVSENLITRQLGFREFLFSAIELIAQSCATRPPSCRLRRQAAYGWAGDGAGLPSVSASALKIRSNASPLWLTRVKNVSG